ncbi:MAG: PP2C family protein-serine/threonine phosphatase, partial [Polyangiaceae bacterium]
MALIVLGWNFVMLRSRISRAFVREDQLQSDIVLASNALKLQLYEAAGIRNVSGDVDLTLRRLRNSLNALGISSAASVAEGALERGRNTHGPGAQLRFRAEISAITDELNERITTTRRDIVQALQRLFIVDITSLFVIMGVFALAWAREAGLTASLIRTEQAYEREREIAKEKTYLAQRLQELYAHEELPRPAGLALSSWYQAAEEQMRIGGDWYIAVSLDEDHLLFGVGDVTGPGLEAALTMGKMRRRVLTLALMDHDPAGILRRLNSEMMVDAQIATAFLGVMTLSERRVSYAIAGHPAQVLVAPDGSPLIT